ncbi:MAG: hypothetical protein K8R02_07795 [Anaerohalosphaeraceae bacterium]|nr:hypothetical protein [Anaerohalosphaeraceae bacterium]
MDKFFNGDKYKKPTKEEHKKIVQFLQKVHFPEYIKKQTEFFDEDKQERIGLQLYEREYLPKYLKEALKNFGVEFRIICKNFGCKGKTTTNISRLTKVINYYLKKICDENKINPPIQLFFYHKNHLGKIVKDFKCHLACASVGKQDNNRRYSYNIVSFKESKTFSGSGMIIREFGPANLKYLRNMKDVLKWEDKNVKAKWFRKTGPIAIDFAEEKVCPRSEVLEGLRKHVFNNKISIIEGNGGSGKSVLVRHMAYDLLAKENESQIYHYSFKLDLPISDFREFKDEINSVFDLVIIEDVHLATHNIQCIVDDLTREHDTGHILLTARPSFRSNMLQQRSDTLEKLPRLTLTAYKEKDSSNIDEIINYYIERNSSSNDWTTEQKNSIKDISKGNLWLLSYALKGFNGNKGFEEPILCIKEGVKSDLEDIRMLKCKPQILVALSPLYINESLTAHSFLVENFDFADEDIYRLIDMGEIIKHEIDGEVYYGLPHSSLASAYWEHGGNYRDSLMKDIDRFLCLYIISEAPNSLSVIFRTDMKKRLYLLQCAAISGHLLEIVKKERDSEKYFELSFILMTNANCFIFQPYSFFYSLGNLFFEREEFAAIENLLIFEFFGLFNLKKFWQQIDKEEFISKLYGKNNFDSICSMLGAIRKMNKKFRVEIDKMINCEKLISEGLNNTYDFEEIAKVLEGLSKIDKSIALNFWQLIDKEKLVGQLYSKDTFSAVCQCLGGICELNDEHCLGIIKAIDYDRLYRRVNDLYNPTNTISILENLSKIHKSVMLGYWNQLVSQKFVIEPKKTIGIVESLGDLSAITRVKVLKYWKQHGLEKTIKIIEGAGAFRLLIDLCYINKAGIDERDVLYLLEHKEYDKYEFKMSQSDWLDTVISFFAALSKLDNDIALEYWHMLNADDLAAAFQLQKASKIASNIQRIFEANKYIGQEFWEEHLDIQRIVPKFCNTNGFWHIFCLAQLLKDEYPEEAKEFCDEFVDYAPKLEKLLKQNKDEFSIIAFVAMLCHVRSQVGEKLRHLIDENIEGSAKQFVQEEKTWGFHDDIIADVDLLAAKRLYKYYCENLGVEKYIEKIKKSNSLERLERCFDFLSKVDPRNKGNWKKKYKREKKHLELLYKTKRLGLSCRTKLFLHIRLRLLVLGCKIKRMIRIFRVF